MTWKTKLSFPQVFIYSIWLVALFCHHFLITENLWGALALTCSVGVFTLVSIVMIESIKS